MIHSKQVGNTVIYNDYQQRCLSPIRRFTTRSPILQQFKQPVQRCYSPIRRSPLRKDEASVIYHKTPTRTRSPMVRTPIKEHRTQQKNIRIQFVTAKTENSPQSQPNSNSKMFNKLMSNIGTNVQANCNQKQNFDVFSLLGDPAFMQNNSKLQSNSRYMEGSSSRNYLTNNQMKDKSIKVGTFSALINNIEQRKLGTKQDQETISQGLFRDTQQTEHDQQRQTGPPLAKIRKNIKNNKVQQQIPSPAKLHKVQSQMPSAMQKPQNAFKYFSVMHQGKNQVSVKKTNEQIPSKKGGYKELLVKAKVVQSIQQDFTDVIGLLNKVKVIQQDPHSKQSNQTQKKTDVNMSNKNISNEESLNMNF